MAIKYFGSSGKYEGGSIMEEDEINLYD